MNRQNEMGGKLLDWVKKNKRVLIAALLLLGGICLLLPSFSKEKEPAVKIQEHDLESETAAYLEQLTEDLTSLLQQAKGVGRVSVLISLDSGVEYEYLKEQKENTDASADDQSRDYSESYLFVEDAAGNKKLLAVRRVLPKVKGAVVVCEGADDPAVKQQVIEILRAYLDLSAANISVLPLQ